MEYFKFNKIRTLGVIIENKRTAVNIGISLSIQLISASLSMMAIIGALLIFVIDKKVIYTLFYVFFILGFIFFLLSIFFGGKGIDKVRKDGFKNDWNLQCSKRYFNRQAILNVLGIIFCLMSFGFTSSKIDEQSSELNRLNKNIEKLIDFKHSETSLIDSLRSEIRNINKRQDLIDNFFKKNH